ncbi:hypothetical protein [Streptomyces tendae]|uniref:hypothetical protein n=1 Tax=Streptomyces tendae TaxID=1932 RepID=UPI003D66229E
MLVTPASTTVRDAARILLPTAKNHFRRLARIWGDGGYTGHLTDWTTLHLGLVLDIVRRSDDVQSFQVLPRRWVVERSLPGSCAADAWSWTTNDALTPARPSSCGR